MDKKFTDKIIKNHKLVERQAKKGEWIYILFSNNSRVHKGEMWEFVDNDGGIFIKHPNGARQSDGAANIGSNSKYLVVQGYPGISFA